MLPGVLLDFEGSTATFVATDALRLALRSAPVSAGRGAMQAIVPARALADLQRALSDEEGEVEVRLAEKQALFITPRGVTVTTRLIEGQYPAYRRVVPTSWRTQVTLPTHALHQAVRRAFIVARHAADRLEFRTLDDKAVLTAESATEGKALEEVEMLREGDDVEVAFSGRYLLDVLAAMDSAGVAIEMTDPTKAAVVRPKRDPEAEDTGEYVCVLMPLQLV
jgi:DNA polymerase-3 subunit beta